MTWMRSSKVKVAGTLKGNNDHKRNLFFNSKSLFSTGHVSSPYYSFPGYFTKFSYDYCSQFLVCVGSVVVVLLTFFR